MNQELNKLAESLKQGLKEGFRVVYHKNPELWKNFSWFNTVEKNYFFLITVGSEGVIKTLNYRTSDPNITAGVKEDIINQFVSEFNFYNPTIISISNLGYMTDEEFGWEDH